MSKRTVFSLGAGASAPFGFPLGYQLKEKVKHAAGQYSATFCRCDTSITPEVAEKLWTLATLSSAETFDAILLNNPDLRTIGRYAIAAVMRPLENIHKVFPIRDWYKCLFTKLVAFPGDNLSWLTIVTLNYERSLDLVLSRKAVTLECPLPQQDRITAKLQTVNIIHAHGSMGTLQEVPYEMPRGVSEYQLNPEHLTPAAKGLWMVGTPMEENPEFQEAQSAICQAQTVYVIGSKYNRATFEALFWQSDPSRMEIVGTTGKSFDKTQKDAVKRIFKNNVTLKPMKPDEFCAKYVKL